MKKGRRKCLHRKAGRGKGLAWSWGGPGGLIEKRKASPKTPGREKIGETFCGMGQKKKECSSK